MKTLLFFSLLCNFAFSQVTTTLDEYNYLTNGMREQAIKGYAFEKTGYSLVEFYNEKINKYTYIISKFVDAENNIKAISIRLFPDLKVGFFMCYPINNDELMKKHLKDGFNLSGSSESHYQIITNALIKCLK